MIKLAILCDGHPQRIKVKCFDENENTILSKIKYLGRVVIDSDEFHKVLWESDKTRSFYDLISDEEIAAYEVLSV